MVKNSNFIQKRRYVGKKLGSVVDRICLKAVSQNSAILYHITKNWTQIVGYELAQVCLPGKVLRINEHFILTIYVSHPALTLEIQARENVILESIARLIGYRMVKKLKFKHVAQFTTAAPKFEQITPKAKPQNISAAQQKQIEDTLQKIKDPSLLHILQELKSSYFNK